MVDCRASGESTLQFIRHTAIQLIRRTVVQFIRHTTTSLYAYVNGDGSVKEAGQAIIDQGGL